MTVYSDRSIRTRLKCGGLGITPLSEEAIQPGSIDLTLGDCLKVQQYGVIIDPETDQSDCYDTVLKRADGRWCIYGHRLYLGATEQQIRIPRDCTALLSGVSSLGRCGLFVENAGWVDPGYVGHLTLELVLIGQAMFLRPGMRIAQLTLFGMDRDAERSYQGRYMNDVLPTPMKVTP